MYKRLLVVFICITAILIVGCGGTPTPSPPVPSATNPPTTTITPNVSPTTTPTAPPTVTAPATSPDSTSDASVLPHFERIAHKPEPIAFPHSYVAVDNSGSMQCDTYNLRTKIPDFFGRILESWEEAEIITSPVLGYGVIGSNLPTWHDRLEFLETIQKQPASPNMFDEFIDDWITDTITSTNHYVWLTDGRFDPGYVDGRDAVHLRDLNEVALSVLKLKNTSIHLHVMIVCPFKLENSVEKHAIDKLFWQELDHYPNIHVHFLPFDNNGQLADNWQTEIFENFLQPFPGVTQYFDERWAGWVITNTAKLSTNIAGTAQTVGVGHVAWGISEDVSKPEIKIDNNAKNNGVTIVPLAGCISHTVGVDIKENNGVYLYWWDAAPYSFNISFVDFDSKIQNNSNSDDSDDKDKIVVKTQLQIENTLSPSDWQSLLGCYHGSFNIANANKSMEPFSIPSRTEETDTSGDTTKYVFSIKIDAPFENSVPEGFEANLDFYLLELGPSSSIADYVVTGTVPLKIRYYPEFIGSELVSSDNLSEIYKLRFRFLSPRYYPDKLTTNVNPTLQFQGGRCDYRTKTYKFVDNPDGKPYQEIALRLNGNDIILDFPNKSLFKGCEKLVITFPVSPAEDGWELPERIELLPDWSCSGNDCWELGK